LRCTECGARDADFVVAGVSAGHRKAPPSPAELISRPNSPNGPVADSPDRKTPVAEPPRSLARDSSIPGPSLECGDASP
jgi:hypothetical protein